MLLSLALRKGQPYILTHARLIVNPPISTTVTSEYLLPSWSMLKRCPISCANVLPVEMLEPWLSWITPTDAESHIVLRYAIPIVFWLKSFPLDYQFNKIHDRQKIAPFPAYICTHFASRHTCTWLAKTSILHVWETCILVQRRVWNILLWGHF